MKMRRCEAKVSIIIIGDFQEHSIRNSDRCLAHCALSLSSAAIHPSLVPSVIPRSEATKVPNWSAESLFLFDFMRQDTSIIVLRMEKLAVRSVVSQDETSQP